VGSTAAARRFSCSRRAFVVPGIGTIHGARASSQGQRELRWGCAVPLADRPQPRHESLVRPPCLNREARQLVAVVRAVEGGVLVDGPGEGAAPERAVGHEPDAQFRAGREDLVLRLTPPQRVLAVWTAATAWTACARRIVVTPASDRPKCLTCAGVCVRGGCRSGLRRHPVPGSEGGCRNGRDRRFSASRTGVVSARVGGGRRSSHQ
jgi:hypothetical protein